jgi:hypothetical protein
MLGLFNPDDQLGFNRCNTGINSCFKFLMLARNALKSK